jgi:hypothetical protein
MSHVFLALLALAIGIAIGLVLASIFAPLATVFP